MKSNTKTVASPRGCLARLVQRLREWKCDGYWIVQALRPHMKISIKTDWQPKYRTWRHLQKANCEICGQRFRGMEGGTISHREKLCEKHCMMTTQEIADYHLLNV